MSKILRDISLRDFGASLNTVESYTNESSYGKIGLYEAVNKQKCTHWGMFLASVKAVYQGDGIIGLTCKNKNNKSKNNIKEQE